MDYYDPSPEEWAFISSPDDDEPGECGAGATVESDIYGPLPEAEQLALERETWRMAALLRAHGIDGHLDEAEHWVRALAPPIEGAAVEAEAWLARGWRSLAIIRAIQRLVGSPESVDDLLASSGISVAQVEQGELPGFCGPVHWLEAAALDRTRRRRER